MNPTGITYTIPWQNQTAHDKVLYRTLGRYFLEERIEQQAPIYSLPDFLVWTIAQDEGQLTGTEPPPQSLNMKIAVRFFPIQRGLGFIVCDEVFRIWHAPKEPTQKQAQEIRGFHKFLEQRNERDGVEIPDNLLLWELKDEIEAERARHERTERNFREFRQAAGYTPPTPRQFSIAALAREAGTARSTMSEHATELRKRNRIKSEGTLSFEEAEILLRYAEDVKREGRRKK